MPSQLRGILRLCALLACVFSATEAFADTPLLHSMFQDHAVLQRDRAIPVWGETRPRERVTVTLDGHNVTARADAHGHWRANLPALHAGGPYQLVARTAHGQTQTLSDVLIGDVFLCSGQSNMEFGVAGSLYGEFEIRFANNDRIRLLTVQHADNVTPQAQFHDPVSWSAVTPDSVRNFSAACYYFARELQKSQNVPLGLIHSSWGGSAIETWISANGMRAVGGHDAQLAMLSAYARNPTDGVRALDTSWRDWWRHAAPGGGEPWSDASAANWSPLPEPMRDWKKWGVPELNRNGTVFFRRSVHLTAAQAAQSASLSLGQIDEIDETWVNGQPIGASFGWSTERTYQVPAHTLHEGDNLVVIAVTSTWDMGGMYGPTDHMAITFGDGAKVPLGGDWSYQAAPANIGYPPRAPWFSINGISPLYNAMIAPIGPYGLKGALWYQGESNTGDADQYQALLAGLMRDWRRQFETPNLPFLIVELPNFGNAPTAPAQSDWASLREAQRRAVEADPHAGLAVTIDVGMNDQLHPPNKQAVGARLARAARHVIYGEAISPSGARVAGARRSGDSITVSFADVDGALVAYSGAPNGFELCGATQASCRFVSAALHDTSVTLPNAGDATRVRYCWGDGPVCNLSDRSGLPAGPFEVAIH
ncbi:MAG: sialate O-acetylesterase [Pseudomonadota bacterium]